MMSLFKALEEPEDGNSLSWEKMRMLSRFRTFEAHPGKRGQR
jgi:hypothetical protein